MTYPLHLVDDRPLPEDYAGPVHVWDIDKTYLDTDLSRPWGLLRIPLEMAIDKRAIPGAVPVLRECRRGPGARPASVPLYFVSASPPQLEAVLRRRMLLDGVEPDGFVFKDQLALALRGRFGELRSQVTYKLTALWALCGRLPRHARLILVGDDWESDALVFSLFAAAQRGALSGEALAAELRAARVRDTAPLVEAARDVAGRARVERACVLLTRGRDPAAFARFAPAVVAAREALQLAALLFAAGLVARDGVGRVARQLSAADGWTTEALAASLADLERRGLVDAEALAALRTVV